MASAPAESSSLGTAITSLQQVVQLSEGLALVLVVGPGAHAPEGLARLRDGLPETLPTAWHHLDRQGADLAATLTEEQPAFLLVHGLEWLAEADRRMISVRLNLLRDTLSAFSVVILLWIPTDFLDSFRQLCPDLFHWRSLLLLLSEEDVPLPPERVARRRFLHLVEEHFSRLRLLFTDERRRKSSFPDLRVRIEDGSELFFSRWAAAVEQGLLLGAAGSGKTTVLQGYTRNRARQAAMDDSVPLPIFVVLRNLVPYFEVFRTTAGSPPDLEGLIPGEMAEGLDPQDASALAAGKLQLLLDGLDEVPENLWQPCLEWLRHLRSMRPEISCIVSSRRAFGELGTPWRVARLQPLSPEEVQAFLQRYFDGRDERARQLGENLERSVFFQQLSSPLTLRLLAEMLERRHGIPSQRYFVLQEIVEAQLVGRERARELGRLRSSASPLDSERRLARLALLMLRHGLHEIDAGVLAQVGLEPDEIRYLTDRAQLIQEQAEGQFSFSHRLLQEYFAARYLLLLEPGAALAELVRHLDDPAWREVILMAVGALVDDHGADWLWANFWPESTHLYPLEQRAARMELAFGIAAEARLREGLREHRLEAERLLKDSPSLSTERREGLQEALRALEETS